METDSAVFEEVVKAPPVKQQPVKACFAASKGKPSLRRYLKSYRSVFVLSEKVFAAVAEKTKSMDSFQRHGGLLIDEIKLPEHLSLESRKQCVLRTPKESAGADNGKDVASQRWLDELLDAGNLAEPHEVLSECGHGTEHAAMMVQTSDPRLVYYMAGYVARNSIASKKCAECIQQLLQDENDAAPGVASLTTPEDRGGLLSISQAQCTRDRS
ncbi:hypothetical protein HPB50_024696 [Hyalomma asiaticum]|uniref:Uncharacterized protein n=1 Tax=Hyalomma asiaticum TaxID=266040 RepID=A0ACB7SMY0_HYAAI|nr:hypothetical protein HPB50_024696 [Hyalomma asiaticum]